MALLVDISSVISSVVSYAAKKYLSAIASRLARKNLSLTSLTNSLTQFVVASYKLIKWLCSVNQKATDLKSVLQISVIGITVVKH